ncbi:MAG: hypothetical protein R3B74_18205 [Nitrospirales bacterium]|nr:hypothetical protein [Nitrospirales bacterium]
MNTQIVMTGAVVMLGTVVATTNLAFSQPEYLHFMRHRDSNGNLMIAPAHVHSAHSEAQEHAVAPAAIPVEPLESQESVVTAPIAQEGPESLAAPAVLSDAPLDPPDAVATGSIVPEGQERSSVVQKTAVPSQPKLLEQLRVDWGMSALDVKANQTIPPAWELRTPVLGESEHRIAYRTQIEGIDASLSYMFYQDQLAQAKYVFDPQHEDSSNFIHDFHAVQDWISQSYGAPTSVQEIWLDTLYQYDKSLWGQALMRGHLVMVSEWKTAESRIALVINGGDDMVGLVADFSSTHILPTPLVDETSSPDTTTPETTEVQSKPDVSL